MKPEECPICWGSHGCSLPRGHEGDHVCGGELGCDDRVGQDGRDASGFQWYLYGDLSWPDWTPDPPG